MSKHTPEPWKISHDDSTEEWSIITNQHGSIIANVNEETGPELVGSAPVMRKMPGLENARRIVACVNACIGIRTEALEHRSHLLKAVDDDIAQLTAQRDQLLAALQGMIDIANDSQGVAGYHLNGEVADWDEFEEWQAACDAIANTKEGAE